MNFLQLDFHWFKRPGGTRHDFIEVDGKSVAVVFHRNDRAKRYKLFVDREGRPRVTIPRRGSRKEAQQLVAEHGTWLAQQIRKVEHSAKNRVWQPGAQIYFRGELASLKLADGAVQVVRLGDQSISTRPFTEPASANLRPVVENYLRGLAVKELPARALELARMQQSPVCKIAVRSQRTRWGSCSRRGTISLNWRLVQVPVGVRDYIIIHELMHLREMNHSRRFWALVEKACPDFQSSETWLRSHSRAIL